MSASVFKSVYADAVSAGYAAVDSAVKNQQIVGMVVGQAKGFGNEIDYSKPVEYVEDGVCGFAWVKVRPANCKFANWLKQSKICRRDSDYDGGISIWVGDFNQSMQKKEIYARAVSKYLKENLPAGSFKSIYSGSRMD